MSQRKRTIAKAGVPVLVAGVVGTVAFAAARPDTPAAQPQVQNSSSGSALRVAGLATASDPTDPATWRLPIETYMPTRAESRLVSSTRDDLMDACMAKAGFPDWEPAPTLPVVGGKNLTDWRYGIHDAALAAKNGYHPDPAAQTAYDRAAAAGAVDASRADDAAVRGCVTEADGTAPVSATADLVQQINGDAYRQAEKSPAVTAVFAQWASCMKDKGYTYAKPMDANDDPSFGDPYTVTDTEIATATTDVACRDRFQVEKIWFVAEVTLQKTAIALHQDELDQVRADMADAVAKAKAAAQ